MKKILLLLLIAPMIGNSQLLDLPVSEVGFIINEESYTVPQGKIMQIVSSSIFDSNERGYFRGYVEYDGERRYTTQYSHPIFPSGAIISNGSGFGLHYTFVLYDLEAQNLAYNAPKQTTPTLYPNPTSSLLALNSDKEYDIEVYDMAGNKLMAVSGNSINMEHLSTATYIVKATDKSNNEELTYKVVKN